MLSFWVAGTKWRVTRHYSPTLKTAGADLSRKILAVANNLVQFSEKELNPESLCK